MLVRDPAEPGTGPVKPGCHGGGVTAAAVLPDRRVVTGVLRPRRSWRVTSSQPTCSGDWTAQQARNLIMDLGEQACRVKFVIRDRSSDFTAAFDAVFADAGIRIVLCSVRTPRTTRSWNAVLDMAARRLRRDH